MTIQILTRSILSILFSSASCRNGRSARTNLYARWSLCQPWSHRLGEHDDIDNDDVDKNGGVDDDEVTKVLFHLGTESTLFFQKYEMRDSLVVTHQATETMMYDMLIGEEDASPNWDPEMNW